MRPKTALFAGLALIIFGAGAAGAQNLCSKYAANGQFDASTITACTKEIHSGSYTGNDLAFLYAVRAVAHDEEKEYDLALSDAERATGLDPSLAGKLKPVLADSYAGRGMTYESRKEYDLAIPDLSRAISINPSLAQAYCYRSDAYRKTGDPAKSQADHDKALSWGWVCRPGAAATADLCAENLIDQQYDNAVRQCTDDINSDSYSGKDLEIKYVDRGESYLANKTKNLTYDESLSAAMADFTKAIELNPSDSGAYLDRGWAHSKIYSYKGGEGEYNLAVADFTRAIQLDPSNAAAYQGRGSIYQDESLGRSPEDKRAYYNLALSDFSRVIELSPADADAYTDRGTVYELMAGNEALLKHPDAKDYYDRALSDFSRAIDLDPSDAEAYCDRGDAYEDEGKGDKAAADHAKARRLGDYMCSN